jgi:hypothetical protein
MRPLLLLFVILIATGGIGTRAEAQNYPWCAYYGSDMGGSENCGFVSFDQCMKTLWGNGGFCGVNTQYVPPPGPHAARRPLKNPHKNS